jgi:hypothetical protein
VVIEMDEFTRRALEILDGRAIAEAEHREWLDQREELVANQECDELLARLEARRLVEKAVADNELVYKVREDSLVREASMDDASAREWDLWARKIARIEAVKLDNGLIDDLDKFHDELKQRIADLEARIAMLEGGKADVIPFGGRSAAANKS